MPIIEIKTSCVSNGLVTVYYGAIWPFGASEKKELINLGGSFCNKTNFQVQTILGLYVTLQSEFTNSMFSGFKSVWLIFIS